jgi:alkylation response protein AidB-like acyl-CoA dehydrogenase
MTSAFPVIPSSNPDITDNLRAILDKLATGAAVRTYEESGWQPDGHLWDELVKGGWTGLALPEDAGGAGRPVTDLHLALHELGRAAAPVPYRSSVVLVGVFLGTDGANDDTRPILESVTNGEIWSPAVTEARWLDTVETRFRGARVSGRKVFVPDAGAAARFLVLALDPDGAPVWAGVDASREGIECKPIANTGNDAMYEVVFHDAPARLAARLPVRRWQTLERFASAAWAVGLMTRAMEIAVDHVKNRVQFGRPIGSFQAVQHRLADSAVEVQACVNMCRSAAMHIDERSIDDPATDAFIAELAYASRRAGTHVARDAHQVLGGVGFTLEHDLHLYTRRVKAYTVLGDLEENLTEEIAAAGSEIVLN